MNATRVNRLNRLNKAQQNSLGVVGVVPDLTSKSGEWIAPVYTSGELYKCTVMLEAVSKANSRRLVWVAGKPRLLLSKGAEHYSKMFNRKIHVTNSSKAAMFIGDVEVRMKLYYATRRKDLDESLALDCLQGIAYVNDRQVKRKLIEWGLDKLNPRCEIEVREILVETGYNHSPKRHRRGGKEKK